jgi:hypothetical protein
MSYDEIFDKIRDLKAPLGRLSNGKKKSFIFLYCEVQKKKDLYVKKTQFNKDRAKAEEV